VSKSCKIALAQFSCVDGNKDANLKKITQGIVAASKEKADVIVFPEMFLTGFSPQREKMEQLGEKRNGPSVKLVTELALKNKINVILGFPEITDSGDLFNTTLIIKKEGQISKFYRKTHLFNKENWVFESGQLWVVDNLEGILTGIIVCYDVEFPETARVMGLRGAELIIIPSANMDPYGHRHRVSIMARALENHAFVAYCNRVGKSGETNYVGESAIVDPNGEIIAQLGRDEEGLLVGEIVADEVNKSKSVFNYLLERKPELYG